MQPVQKGVVGINIYSYWSYPLTNSTADLEATQRYKDFLFGWYDILPPSLHQKHTNVHSPCIVQSITALLLAGY